MLFLSNITYWSEAGYFDMASHNKWLLHTWSLSVEWQFYIIYPLLLVTMQKFMSLKSMKLALLISTIVLLLFSIIATFQWPNPAYYLLPTRAWEMMLGGIAYAFPFAIKQQYKSFVQLTGLAMIIGAYLFISKETPWPGYLAIFPVLGAFLVIQSQHYESAITNNFIFQKLGAWSYSIYLWHWPFVVAIYYFSLESLYVYLGILLSILLGCLSYHLVEKRKFKKALGSWSLLKYKPLLTILIIISFSSYSYIDNGDNGWLSRQDIPTQQTYSLLTRMSHSGRNWGLDETGQQDFSQCRFNASDLTNGIASRLKQCAATYGSGVLILGDSHAIDLFGMISSRFNHSFIVGITSAGCRIWNDQKVCPYDEVTAFIKENKNIFDHVIYEQAGFYLLLDEHGQKGSRFMFDKLALDAPIERISIDTEHVKLVIDYLTELSKLTHVTWFGSRVEPHFTYKQILQKNCTSNFTLRSGQKAPFIKLDDHIRSKVKPIPNLKFVSQNKTLNYSFPQDFMSCEHLLWADGDHLSANGEVLFGKRLPDDFLKY
ncbi:acyltransferase family protein [Psychromonas sp. GE-S-Ul-11]|uniref:acyltransferase family protein n=1 Tax=Psychromonas sp. GE-S-Ul-11 TaxID=3241170 RepID=UPI003AAFF395